MTFGILIPVRNPTEVFAQTIDSLAAQTDKNFSVLISDNFSTNGHGHIERALHVLQAAGIIARVIRPPMELERVEHWNWVHYQSKADWLKPLFAGDWLEPDYVATLHMITAGEPRCAYVFCGFQSHQGDEAQTVVSKWTGRFYTLQEMQEVVLRHGMQFGPPSAAAYKRTAFFALGGYPTALPIVADSFFFCTMAARFGTVGVQKALCHFQLHGGRFSISLPGRRRDTFRESITYFFMLAYHAWTERDAFPVVGFLRLLARTTKHYLNRT